MCVYICVCVLVCMCGTESLTIAVIDHDTVTDDDLVSACIYVCVCVFVCMYRHSTFDKCVPVHIHIQTYTYIHTGGLCIHGHTKSGLQPQQ
jgi:hypothetical protein